MLPLCAGAMFSVPALKPHIAFMLVDDLGYNDFWKRSSDLHDAWPNVNRMSRSSIFVDRYYTQPICTPTRGAFMSGRYPVRLGLQGPVLNPGDDWSLPTNETTLADKMKAAGYRCHLVGKWHLGMYSRDVIPTGRGFDSSYGYFGGQEDYLTHSSGTAPGATVNFLDLFAANGSAPMADFKENNTYSAGLFTSRAVDVVDAHAKEYPSTPLFLYFPMQTVHSPLEVPTKYLSRSPCNTVPNNNRRTFCGMAAAADESIGNLTKALESALGGDSRPLLIVIAGDNGGMPGAAGNNFPLRGHKAELFEGGIRNNALVYSTSSSLVPERARGSTYTGGMVHVLDWHAAFAKLAGYSSNSSDFPLDGDAAVFDALVANASSPRSEFLVNIYDGGSMGPAGAAYLEWPWKLYLGVNNASWTPVPTDAKDDDETMAETAGAWEVEAGAECGAEAGAGAGAGAGGTCVHKGDGAFVYIRAVGSSLNLAHSVDRAIALRHASAAERIHIRARLVKMGEMEEMEEMGEGSGTGNFLFNVQTDPNEHVNVYVANPAVVQRIFAKITTLRTQAIPVCQDGGVQSGAGQGCDYSDPKATAKAKATGAWEPWY